MPYLFILAVLLTVAWRFRYGYLAALSASVTFLVVLPKKLELPLPDGFPELTVLRLLVLLLMAFWLLEKREQFEIRNIPFRGLIFGLLFMQALSTLFAEDIGSSLKEFLCFGLESVLYFFLVVTTSKNQFDARVLGKAMSLGLCVAAALGFIEYYNGFSPMQYFPGYYPGTVMGTYSHRILLGVAMAMGWPLCMFWETVANSRKERLLAQLAGLLCIGVCFFAHSRGPWLAMGFVGLIVGLLGSGKQRWRLLAIGAVALCVVSANSGVRDTILARAGSTFDNGSAQQESYQWRWELWRKAWKEISKSPMRLLLGYGPGASEALNWEDQVAWLDRLDDYKSWDNRFAAYLLECGLLGLLSLAIFHLAALWRMFKIYKVVRGRDKDLVTFIFGALVVFVFMECNVQIFAPQLYFIFWTCLACGIALESEYKATNSECALAEDDGIHSQPALSQC